MTVPRIKRHQAMMLARNRALPASPIARLEKALATAMTMSWPRPCLFSHTAATPSGSSAPILSGADASVGVAVQRSAGNSENASIDPTPVMSGCIPAGEIVMDLAAGLRSTRLRNLSRSEGAGDLDVGVCAALGAALG